VIDMLQMKAAVLIRIRDYDQCVNCGEAAQGVTAINGEEVSLYNAWAVCGQECAKHAMTAEQLLTLWVEFGVEQSMSLLDIMNEEDQEEDDSITEEFRLMEKELGNE